jgi:hypothetical protein
MRIPDRGKLVAQMRGANNLPAWTADPLNQPPRQHKAAIHFWRGVEQENLRCLPSPREAGPVAISEWFGLDSTPYHLIPRCITIPWSSQTHG